MRSPEKVVAVIAIIAIKNFVKISIEKLVVVQHNQGSGFQQHKDVEDE